MSKRNIMQNRFILGFASLLIVFTAFAFVLSPTKVSAQTLLQTQKQGEGIVVFGRVTDSDGDAVGGVDTEIGARKENTHNNKTRIFDRATSNQEGYYKLWVSNKEVRQLKQRELVFALRPNDQVRYEQVVDLRRGDVAAVDIQMRTPVVPVFPFTVFVY